MDKKIWLAATLAVVGAMAIGSSSARPPPLGTEQFEEWYGNDGSLNGYRHWTCNGDLETWGSMQGNLVVTQRPCPGR